MGIGVGMVAIGTFLGAGTGVAAGIVGGAIVGAAIGGLTSAIMGGSIMKGVLFGAIGGAVTGGMAGYAAGATPAYNAVIAGGSGPGGLGAGAFATPTVQGAVYSANVAGGMAQGAATISSTLGDLGTGMVKQFGGDFVKGVAGAYMKGKEADAAGKQAMKLSQQNHEQKMAELKHAAELSSKYSSDSGGSDVPHMEMKKIDDASRRAELAEHRRQYDVGAGERSQAREDLQEKEAGRRALFTGYKRGADDVEEATQDQSVLDMRQGDTENPLTNAGTAQPGAVPGTVAAVGAAPAAGTVAPLEEEKTALGGM